MSEIYTIYTTQDLSLKLTPFLLSLVPLLAGIRMELSPDFVKDTLPLLRKSFATHEVSYRDVAARAVVDHTIFRLNHINVSYSVDHLSAHDGPICIVGAGVAGLYAAMILQDLGVEYEIIEASDRIGGRLHTHRFNGEKGYNAPRNTPARYDYYDIGAMRFPEIPFMKRVFDLFQRIRIKDLLIPYTYNHPNNLLYYNLQPPVTSEVAAQAVDYFHVSVSHGGIVPDSYAEESSDHWISKIYDLFKELFTGMDDPDPEASGHAFQKAWKELTSQDHFSTRGYMLAGQAGKPDNAPGPYPNSVVHWLEKVDSATGLYDEAFVESVIVSFHVL